MTLAWRMYVWAGKPVGREYAWLEGIYRRGRGGKPGPAIAKRFQSIGRGEQNKGRYVPAVLPQGREWIKRCCSAWAFSSSYRNAQGSRWLQSLRPGRQTPRQ